LFLTIVGVGVALYLYFDYDTRQQEKRQLHARALISYSDIFKISS